MNESKVRRLKWIIVKLRERVAFYPFFFLMALCQFCCWEGGWKERENFEFFFFFFFYWEKKISASRSISLVFMSSFDISQILKWFYFMSSLWLKLKLNMCVWENRKFYNLIFGGNVHLKRPNLKKVLWEYMWSNFGQVLWTEIFSKLKTIKTNLAFGKVRGNEK